MKLKIFISSEQTKEFNETFRKDVAHGNIKSHKNTGFHSLSLENTFLEKPQRGQIDSLPALLGLKLLQSHMNEATWT